MFLSHDQQASKGYLLRRSLLLSCSRGQRHEHLGRSRISLDLPHHLPYDKNANFAIIISKGLSGLLHAMSTERNVQKRVSSVEVKLIGARRQMKGQKEGFILEDTRRSCLLI